MSDRLHAIEDTLHTCDLRATANWIESLEQRIRELEAVMERAGRGLTKIVRMPNAEYVADEHNECVRLIKEALLEPPR